MFHIENQLPRLPGPALKVHGLWGGGRFINIITYLQSCVVMGCDNFQIIL